MKSTTMLRSMFSRIEPVRVLGAHNGLTARLAEQAGADAVWASGLEISAAAAVPDANILTMTDLLAAARQMQDAVSVPVVADCDTGFGGTLNVVHMVRCYEAAGIAAVCIEDKPFPKINSLYGTRRELAPVDEFVAKIVAAKSAQRDPDFMLIARVEALVAGQGEREALRRAEAYRRAGADAILIHSCSESPDEIVSFLDRWARRTPVVVVPTTYTGMSARELYAAGADMVIYANHGLRAAMEATTRIFAEILRRGGTREIESVIAPLTRVFEIQGMDAVDRQHVGSASSAEGDIRAVIPAAGDLLPCADLRRVVGANVPRALLDLYGKPLLQRQVETLRQCGVEDIVVVGLQRVPDAIGPVRHLSGGSMLESIRAGLQCLPATHARTVIAFSDVLFDVSLLRVLLSRDAPISILVDRTRETMVGRERKKAVTRVACRFASSPQRDSAEMEVIDIGKHIPAGGAPFELVGLFGLTGEGVDMVEEACERYGQQFGTRRFGTASSFGNASLADLFQAMIHDGYPVVAVESNGGWHEIHDFEDYREAVRLVQCEDGVWCSRKIS